jgi:magnesium chelatase family protein
MFARVKCIAFRGLNPVGVDVEVNINPRGIPAFDIVGLPDKSVEESKHRVKTAIINSGFEFPNNKITVNLAPADIHKEGSFYDLPIAVGIFCASNKLSVMENSLYFGELSMDGLVRHTRGTFLLASYALESKCSCVVVSGSSVTEIASFDGLKIYGVEKLSMLFMHLLGKAALSPSKTGTTVGSSVGIDTRATQTDIADIVGQVQAKRALEICAAGHHNLMMIGPPGTGKTMLARSLVNLLPDLTLPESIEVTRIYSFLGKIPPNVPMIMKRPFRDPHNTVSYAGMFGGGSEPLPGEASMAHRGVLYMDEFCEFSRNVVEGLRQPLQDGCVSIARSRGNYTFPAKFMLVASSNPCPCGFLGHPTKECSCPESKINSYKRKMSGPIMDRIDLHAYVMADEILTYGRMVTETARESSADVRKRIILAREIQRCRFAGTGLLCNSEIRGAGIKHFCRLDSPSQNLLDTAAEKLSLSPRSYYKILNLSRTVADLENSREIRQTHVAEALQYRQK